MLVNKNFISIKLPQYLLLIYLFIHNVVLFSQNREFDSLKSVLKSTNDPADRAALLIKIARSIYIHNPDSSFPYCQQAEITSKNSNNEVQLGYAFHCEARYYLVKGDLTSSLQKISEAIKLFEKTNEKTGLARCYSLKSVALGRLNKNEETIEYLLRSRTIYEETKDTDGLAGVLTNLSNSYCELKQYDKGFEILNEYRKLNLKRSDRDFFYEISLGKLYFETNKYIEAIDHFKTATQIAKQYKMLDSEITGLTLVAECYTKLNNIIAAKSFYSSAIELSVNNKLIVEEAEALKGIINVYESEQDFKNAYASVKKLKSIEDSIFNIEKIKSINEIENKLQITSKEKIIAEQNLKIEKEKTEQASLKSLLIAVFVGLAFLVIILIVLFKSNQRTKQFLSLIEKQKQEVENQKEIIEIKNKDVMDSIMYARHIQASMLPSVKILSSLFKDHFILYKPKDVVAGDFYWTEKVNENIFFVAGDCTGHGVPGAMVSVVACNSLNRAVNEFKLNDPGLIFDKVNALMQETFSKSDHIVNDGMDGVLCMFDVKNSQLYYTGAHNPILIASNSNEGNHITILTTDKQPIGRFKENTKPFQTQKVELKKGETIYLYTDGFADQFGGPKGKKYKNKRLQEFLKTISPLDLKTQKEKLNSEFENWRGKLDQVDDVLVVGIRI